MFCINKWLVIDFNRCLVKFIDVTDTADSTIETDTNSQWKRMKNAVEYIIFSDVLKLILIDVHRI